MPEIPHEYVVRTPENEEAYVALFNLIVRRVFMKSGAGADISITTRVTALSTGAWAAFGKAES
jgi:hypothetical protein